MHLTPWLVFFLIYFIMGLYYCYADRDFSPVNFLIRGMFGRIPVAGVFAFLYYIAQEEPVTTQEILPQQETVPHLDLSDIMTDDLKDHEVQMDTVYILGED